MPNNLLIRPTSSGRHPRMQPVGINERLMDPPALTA